MLPGMKTRLAVILTATAVGLVLAAQSSAQPQTTNAPQAVTVKITISDRAITVSPKAAQRGSIGRFVLVNVGKKPHTFVLGHERRGTGQQTGFSKSLAANQQAILILFLDFRGKLLYSGTLPADRSKTGMKGAFRIT